MGVVGSVKALFSADVSGLEAGTAKAKKVLDGLGNKAQQAGSVFSGAFSGMGGIAAGLGITVGIAAVVKLGSAIKDAAVQADKLKASGRTLDVIFGQSSDKVKGTIDGLAKGLGMARVETAQAAVQIGANLTNAGISASSAAEKTNVLLKRAADMAAATGYAAGDAVEAIASALRGEYDPIEKFGVGVKAAAVEAELLRQGVKKINGEFSVEAKTLATINLLMDQTNKYNGAAASGMHTASGALAKLSSVFSDFITTIGEVFGPAVAIVAKSLSGWIMLFDRIANAVKYVMKSLYELDNGVGSWEGPKAKIAPEEDPRVKQEKSIQQSIVAAQRKALDLKEKIQQIETDKMVKAWSDRSSILDNLKKESVAKQYGANDEVMQLLELRKQLGNSAVMNLASQMDQVNKLKDNRIEPEAFQSRSATMAEAGTQQFYKLALSAQGYDRTPEKDTAKNTTKMAETLDKMLKAIEGGTATPELASF